MPDDEFLRRRYSDLWSGAPDEALLPTLAELHAAAAEANRLLQPPAALVGDIAAALSRANERPARQQPLADTTVSGSDRPAQLLNGSAEQEVTGRRHIARRQWLELVAACAVFLLVAAVLVAAFRSNDAARGTAPASMVPVPTTSLPTSTAQADQATTTTSATPTSGITPSPSPPTNAQFLTPQPDTWLTTTWQLQSIDGVLLPPDAFITFVPATEGRVLCNFHNYELHVLDPGALQITLGAMTAMGCQVGSLSFEQTLELSDRYLDILSAVSHYAVNDNELLLSTPGGQELRYVAGEILLRSSDDAVLRAMELAESVLQTSDHQFAGNTLSTLADALEAQQRATGTHMAIWDDATYQVPVWTVQLSGAEFRVRDCDTCPVGSAALLTLRASDGALYWAAVGDDIDGGLTQVIPTLQQEQSPEPPPSDPAMVEAAREFLRSEFLRYSDVSMPEDTQLLLARPITSGEIARTIPGMESVSPTCRRPGYVVVLAGDFGNGLTHAGVVFDLADGNLGSVVFYAVEPTSAVFDTLLNTAETPGTLPGSSSSIVDPPVCETVVN